MNLKLVDMNKNVQFYSPKITRFGKFHKAKPMSILPGFDIK